MEYPNVYIHPDAKIGADVKIDPFTCIHEDVEIGEGSWIGSNVTLMPGTRIGKYCKIHSGAVIGGAPQDLKYKGEKTYAFIGDYTVIREFVTVNIGTEDRWETRIGSHCLLMAYVHVAHDCIVGNHCILANSVQLAGHVVMGDYAIMGGLSAAHQFVHIGAHAMIAGGCIVLKDVPPFVKAGRSPLSYAGVNSIGLRRRDFSSERIYALQDIYRLLYLSGMNNKDALASIENQLPFSEDRDFVVEFVKSSKRGIIRGYHSKTGQAEEGEL